MARGRPSKPTALKKLEGNPGHRPINAEEPHFSEGPLTPPERLDAVAKAEWNRVAPELSEEGMFAVTDRSMLAAYCVAYSRWLAAEQAVQKAMVSGQSAHAQGSEMMLPLAGLPKDHAGQGGMVFKTHSGYFQQIPQISIARSYFDQMHKIAVEFGFTPASRSRIRAIPVGDQKGDEFDNFMRGRQVAATPTDGPHAHS